MNVPLSTRLLDEVVRRARNQTACNAGPWEALANPGSPSTRRAAALTHVAGELAAAALSWEEFPSGYRAQVRADLVSVGAAALLWLRVFGSRQVPVKSPLPHRGSAPEHPEALFYELDLAALDPGQRWRLVEHLAERFGIPPAEVAAELMVNGYVPLLADDLTLTIDARAVL